MPEITKCPKCGRTSEIIDMKDCSFCKDPQPQTAEQCPVHNLLGTTTVSAPPMETNTLLPDNKSSVILNCTCPQPQTAEQECKCGCHKEGFHICATCCHNRLEPQTESGGWIKNAMTAIEIFYGQKRQYCPVCGINPEKITDHVNDMVKRIVDEAIKSERSKIAEEVSQLYDKYEKEFKYPDKEEVLEILNK